MTARLPAIVCAVAMLIGVLPLRAVAQAASR
jgi:hypothetical protein